MPKRTSSNGKKSKTRGLGRDLHWYDNEGSHRGERHEDEIQAIIKAVGVPLKAQNTATSRRELSYDIGKAETLYWTAIDVRGFRNTQKQLGMISKSAARLKNLLNNEDAWRSIAPHIPLLFDPGSENRTFSRGALDTLLRATKKALESVSSSVEVLKEERLSEILIAQLMDVFEDHFAADARINRPSDEEKNTPYLRFVKIVLRKTSLPDYDNETIIRATSKARRAKQARAA